MSLRARVIAAIAAVLLISVWLGALFAGYEARRSLQDELSAGLAGARQTVSGAFEDLPRSNHQDRDLHQLVAAFDGDRHVSAALIDAEGQVVARSVIALRRAVAPGWFKAWLGPAPAPVDIATPPSVHGYRAIRLQPTADPDVGTTLREFAGVVLILLGAVALSLLAVALVIKTALRPLEALSGEVVHVGAGDYQSRVAAHGPAELRGLQRGFNAMVAQLAAMAERNRALGDQLATLQEEERAEVARDLHDEIGAHLFAVNMDAKMIAKAGERDPAIVELAGSVQTAVGHMQRHVRDLLMQLRPTRIIELGLETALRDLVRHWSARRPEIGFHLHMEGAAEPGSDQTAEVIYRVAQEALSNAVRHGHPTNLNIEVQGEDREITVVITDDGRAHGAASGDGGFGLIGMRERVAGCGGHLSFGPRRDSPGWRVSARLPRESAPAPADEVVA